MGCIYMAENRTNGKRYIGQTIGSLKSRRNGHEQSAKNGSANTPFYNALRKHGPEAFKWRTVCKDVQDDELDDLERLVIEVWNTRVPFGYNLASGGSSGRHAERSKIRISITLTGHPVLEETKEKIRQALLGRKCPEHSARMKGRKHTLETKSKMSKAHRGRLKTAEAIRNWKIAMSNRTPEAKRKSMIGLRKYNAKRVAEGISEETREKLRASHVGKTQSEESKRKRSASLKGRKRSAEVRLRMKVAQLKRRIRELEALLGEDGKSYYPGEAGAPARTL